MATNKSMKKPVKEESVNVANVTLEETTEVVAPAKKSTKKTKEYQNGDMIPCRSVTAGEMFCSGRKSGILYKWAAQGTIEDVRYEDLVYMRDSRSSYVYNPRFVIEDAGLLATKGWEKVQAVYDDMFTQRDIEEILNLPVAQFTAVLEKLPKTIQTTIKIMVAERIENNTFDSMQKIKVIDSTLGSDLMCLIK